MIHYGPREAAIGAVVLAAPAVAAEARAAWQPRLAGEVAECGGILVATCQRVEAWAPDGGALAAAGAVPGARTLSGSAAVRHAVALAVGLESAVLAEDQLLHQVRSAVAEARRRGLAGDLEPVFAAALRAGRTARSWRPAPARSLADVAVDNVLASTVQSDGAGTVLVVGAGEMGRLAAAGLAARGVPVAVSSRDPRRARTLAERAGGEQWPFDPGSLAARVRGVVVALAGPWTVAPATIALLPPAAVVADLSLPAAVPAAAAAVLGPRLRGVDAVAALAAIEPPSRSEAAFRTRLEALVARTVEELGERLAHRDSAAIAAALATRAEEERVEELAALWRRLPDLPPDDRAAIEGMSRHLAGRLLRRPLERLGRDADGRGRRAARELFGL